VTAAQGSVHHIFQSKYVTRYEKTDHITFFQYRKDPDISAFSSPRATMSSLEFLKALAVFMSYLILTTPIFVLLKFSL